MYKLRQISKNTKEFKKTDEYIICKYSLKYLNSCPINCKKYHLYYLWKADPAYWESLSTPISSHFPTMTIITRASSRINTLKAFAGNS